MKKILLMAAVAFSAMVANAQKCVWGVKGGLDLTSYNIGVDGLSTKLNTGNKTGLYLGVVNNLSFCEQWGVQTELLYNYAGTELSIDSDLSIDESEDGVSGGLGSFGKVGISYNTHTLRLPILAKFQPVGGLSVLAGPYLSFRMGGKLNPNSTLKQGLEAMLDEVDGNNGKAMLDEVMDKADDFLSDNLKKFDIGAALGVEYAFKNGVFVEARYNVSFLNKLKNELDLSSVAEYTEKINFKDMLGAQPKVKYSSVQIGIGYRF